MKRKRAAQMGTAFESHTAVGRWAVDEMLESYVSWREECHGVRLAYQRWLECARTEGRLAYACYVAALDREERAARAYAHQVGRLLA
jgi:hypothetical protein